MGKVIDITDRIKKRQEKKPEDDCGLLTLAKHYSPTMYDVLTEITKDKREEKENKKKKKKRLKIQKKLIDYADSLDW